MSLKVRFYYIILCIFMKSVTYVDRSSFKVSRVCRVGHLCKVVAFVGSRHLMGRLCKESCLYREIA